MLTNPIKAFEEALRKRPEGISPYIIQDYVGGLRKFSEWFVMTNGERMLIKNVTPIDIRDYKDHLQTANNYKPSTINHHLSILRAFFSWALENGWVDKNPVDVLKVEEPQIAQNYLGEKVSSQLQRAIDI